ncbi:hypothetical protein P171DRAFT_76700 [Karstenula rhodostoma CBS 690.94]|uniref:Uncharacterized protein n=1 Tax=Karstenula rhodostoma CBS 690.94 TaxID=1392251 RepID=A0A9P4PCQ4_9PLEO|nr:hypothetical protein P171DRAFT_76700 [Karstenula rhodostoma CBS 690.94]
MAPGKSSTTARGGLHREGSSNKRRKTSEAMTTGPGFSCFTLDGNDVSPHRRSAFSPKRKAEVKGIRKKGACLRCRILKRACSGETPCKTCIIAARAAANSKALMWMECIRPSFQTINIFSEGVTALPRPRIDSIIDHLSIDDVYLDFHIPFALNVDAASSHLARWLAEDDASPSLSVVGVFSCSSNTNMLQNALDPNLARYLRLFVHLTTHLYTTGMQGGYEDYTDEEIRSVRDCVGDRLLRALDPLVRPAEIEASEDKLAKLRSLFLLLLGTVVGMRYTCSDVFDQTVARWSEHEAKQEALLRLLCHYLIYIGKATALLESSSEEKTLLDRWRTQWNNPAAFTWNCNQGLEMHYRIEPPANWIVSSSEDESLSSIDVDLSEFDDVAMFTEDGDLLKCTSCGTLWTELDQGGLCLICQKPEYQDEGFTQLISFESDFDLHTGQTIGVGQQLDLDMTTQSFQPSSLADSAVQEAVSTATEDGIDFFPFDRYGNLLEPDAPITTTGTSFVSEDLG